MYDTSFFASLYDTGVRACEGEGGSCGSGEEGGGYGIPGITKPTAVSAFLRETNKRPMAPPVSSCGALVDRTLGILEGAAAFHFRRRAS